MSAPRPTPAPAPRTSAHHADHLDHLDQGALTAVAQFGLPAPRRLEVVTSGLMNRNWRVTCPGPDGDQVWALKQVLDVDAA